MLRYVQWWQQELTRLPCRSQEDFAEGKEPPGAIKAIAKEVEATA